MYLCIIFSCSMWNLVLWPGIEPEPPVLRAKSLSHWTTREVLDSIFDVWLLAAFRAQPLFPIFPTSGQPRWEDLCRSLQLSHFSHVWLFATLGTVALQAPLSMEFSRQEYWSRFPCPSPGDLPNPGIETRSAALQADSSPSSHQGSPQESKGISNRTDFSSCLGKFPTMPAPPFNHNKSPQTTLQALSFPHQTSIWALFLLGTPV